MKQLLLAVWNYYLLVLETFLLALTSAFFLRPKVNATFNLHPYHFEEENNKKSLLKRGNTRDFETQTISEALLVLGKEIASGAIPMDNNNVAVVFNAEDGNVVSAPRFRSIDI